MSTINPSKSFAENRMPLQSGEYDSVCVEYEEKVGTDSNHYVCPLLEDGKKTITMGIGKNFQRGVLKMV